MEGGDDLKRIGSFGEMTKIFWNYIVVMIAQYYECTKSH